jgi:Na+(H+)/acetate symporter ActP
MTSSSTLTIDFIKGNIIKKMDDKKQVLWIRVLIVVFIIISVILAIVQYKSSVTFIAQLMGVSWGAMAGAFLAPFLYGLYWKGTTKAGCMASFIFGAGFMICNMIFGKQYFPVLLKSPINAGALAMLAGLVIVPVVSLISKKPDKADVDKIFSCYDKKNQVPVTQSLE